MSKMATPGPMSESEVALLRRRRRLLVAKNINFNAPRAAFKNACRERLSQPDTIRFIWRPSTNPRRPHLGWAFLGFDNRPDCHRAQTELDRLIFRSRVVTFELANRTAVSITYFTLQNFISDIPQYEPAAAPPAAAAPPFPVPPPPAAPTPVVPAPAAAPLFAEMNASMDAYVGNDRSLRPSYQHAATQTNPVLISEIVVPAITPPVPTTIKVERDMSDGVDALRSIENFDPSVPIKQEY